jgi:transcriptional regulator with PAS, ATPase and Fis domain
LPALYKGVDEKTFSSEREILYQVLFDMKKDMNDLKKLVLDLMRDGNHPDDFHTENAQIIHSLYKKETAHYAPEPAQANQVQFEQVNREDILDTEEFVEESLSLEDKEIELIKKALEKHKGKRKYAAQELGISERTLYRKIKEYDID